MKTSKKHRALFMIIAVMLCAVMMGGMTAYAYTDESAETVTGGDLEIDLTEAYDPEQTPEPPPSEKPLTPPGNLSLVDDLSGEQSESKQFITVITKSGNYFYIIIDRAGDTENVHFLNLVDEADLLAILEAEKDPNAPPAPVQPTTPEQPATTPDPAPETPEKSNNMTGLLVILLLVAAGGGGAFYYFKVLKPKQGGKAGAGMTELDEFDFDADEDDFISADTGEQDSGGDYDGDTDEDIPDFTISEPDDNESEGEE